MPVIDSGADDVDSIVAVVEVDAGSSTTQHDSHVENTTSYDDLSDININSDTLQAENVEVEKTDDASSFEDTDVDSDGNSIPIPVVSSVIHHDSIVCLTPDEDEDIVTPVNNNNNNNNNSRSSSFEMDDQQPCSSRMGMEEQQCSEDAEEGGGDYFPYSCCNIRQEELDEDVPSVRAVETGVEPEEDIDKKQRGTLQENHATETPPVEVRSDSTLDVSSKTLETCEEPNDGEHVPSVEAVVPKSLETVQCEMPAATSDTQTDAEAVSPADTPSSEATTPPPTTTTEDVGEACASDNVFDSPSAEGATSSTTPNDVAGTSSQDVPTSRTSTRSSGSVRRVRFSLDNEHQVHDEDDASSRSSSFLEQPAQQPAQPGMFSFVFLLFYPCF